MLPTSADRGRGPWALPDHRLIDEPYYQLEAEGYVFADDPSVEDFEVQLERPDRIITSEASRLRRRVDAALGAGLLAGEWGIDVPVLAVSGTPRARMAQVLARLAAVEEELRALHGMGPKALGILAEALEASGRQFRQP